MELTVVSESHNLVIAIDLDRFNGVVLVSIGLYA